MKKIIFVSAAALLSFMSIQAQTGDNATSDSRISRQEKKEMRKEEGREVSYSSKEAFAKDFGYQTSAAWRRTDHFDEASFINNGIATTAFYDINAELVGTTSMKEFADLPQSAQKKISKEYKDYTVENVVFFDDNEDNDSQMILFGNQFDDKDNYFVELQKDNKKIIVQVTMDGAVGYFSEL